MAEIATTLAPPQAAHLAEAALGCFKDEVLHLLTKKKINFQAQHSTEQMGNNITSFMNYKPDEKEDTSERIKFGLSKAMQEPEMMTSNKPWDCTAATTASFEGTCNVFPTVTGFQFSPVSFVNEGDGSPWSQSVCTGSTCTAMGQQGQLHEKLQEENGDDSNTAREIRNGSSLFNAQCVLWDLPSEDLINPMV